VERRESSRQQPASPGVCPSQEQFSWMLTFNQGISS
jgi:hypothetical protein